MGTAETLALCCILLIGLGYAFSACRHARAREEIDTYLEEFKALCDDDTVNIETLEGMQRVFAVSCRACAAWTVIVMMLLNKYSKTYRDSVSSKTTISLRDVQPETLRRIVRTYGALFVYASYALPILGGILRLLVRDSMRRIEGKRKPAIFLVVGQKLASGKRLSFAIS